MRFKYVASQPDGKLVEGFVEAQSTAEILTFLSGKNLKPVSIVKVKGAEGGRLKKIFGQRINTLDKIFLTKYLSLMLKVGTDLFKAIDILIADFEKQIVKAFLVEIRGALERGQPFYSTFEKYPQYFSPVFINLVKAGESSGTLGSVFEDLSSELERERDLQNKIRSALFYPSMLLGLSLLILIFLVVFAIPRIANVFLSAGIKPPLFSRIVFSTGLFLGQYIWFIIIGLVALIFGGWIFLFRTATGRRVLNKVLLSLPIVKKVAHKIALQRFAATLSSLMKAGLPIMKSLEITAEAVGDPNLRDSLRRISIEGVAKGLTLGEAFRKETAFPAVVSNLVVISEKAGHLDEILRTLADFYESEIDTSLKNLVTIIEPVLLLFVGSIIGFIALSIIVPIYQLVGQF